MTFDTFSTIVATFIFGMLIFAGVFIFLLFKPTPVLAATEVPYEQRTYKCYCHANHDNGNP